MLKSTLTALTLSALLTSPVLAQGSFENASNASGNSAEASAELALSGVQVALGVVAVPIVIVGAGLDLSGDAASATGGALWDAANAPLEVSQETVIAQPAPNVPQTPQPTREPARETCGDCQ
ncbi:hypothetical protein [Asticcacaulis tiandongensis]|uniref:hypothetical protein n=1 Tax=Asticcacaulis tiandongensis TaxID=2565365 RepID=UPI00112BC005|nr:hypothetical protein [Asticcacaulis tiandongensis]